MNGSPASPRRLRLREAVTVRTADQNGLSAPEISVGPLASRGSAPLGPLLGTIQGDRTHSIDRDERAFDLAMEQLGSGVGPEGLVVVGPQVQTDSVGRESADPQFVTPRDTSGSPNSSSRHRRLPCAGLVVRSNPG